MNEKLATYLENVRAEIRAGAEREEHERRAEKEREKGLDKRGNHARMVRRPENVARRRALLQEVLGDWIDEMYG